MAPGEDYSNRDKESMPIPFSDEIAGDLFLRQDIGFVETYIDGLVKSKVPVVYETSHLAAILGFKEEFLFSVSASAHKFYRRFYIKKRSGDLREISEPLPTLKEIQGILLRDFFSNVKTHRAA